MNLHEFQAKQLFSQFGIPVPEARVADSVAACRAAAGELGGEKWMIKAQVHAGGRGKAGGVLMVDSLQALEEAADQLLGSQLVTGQSAPHGQPVNQVLIEQPGQIAAEYYLGMLVDRSLSQVVFMASAAGGMNIEEVAHETPEKILTVPVHPSAGLQGYQCRQLAFGLGLEKQLKSLTAIMQGLYRLFLEKDLSLVEINPLALTVDGDLLAVDAKINLDDSALYRHPDLQALRDASQEDERENRAHQHGLNYVSLEGNIGCMVNGAGLAMATMDLIQLHGGQPANFLDVGGGTTADKVAEAFKLILSDSKVQAILVNIFGGIVRCDLIAEGIIQAVRETGLDLPVVVRLEGTNVEQGRALLEKSGLDIIAADGLGDAATRVVEAAGGSA